MANPFNRANPIPSKKVYPSPRPIKPGETWPPKGGVKVVGATAPAQDRQHETEAQTRERRAKAGRDRA